MRIISVKPNKMNKIRTKNWTSLNNPCCCKHWNQVFGMAYLPTSTPDLNKRHLCLQCGNSYKVKGHLTRHQRYECGREPAFQCPYCEHRSKREFHLRDHIRRIHPNSLNLDQLPKDPLSFARYSCADCGRSYNRKDHLNQHHRYECGQEPSFSCPYCDQRSSRTFNIKKHIESKHPTEQVYVINLRSQQT